MADYEFMYQLEKAPEARTDGSGVVMHSVWAVYRLQGTNDAWTHVPGHHLDIPIPASELSAIIALGVLWQIATAYVNALVAHRGETPEPMASDWSDVMLQAYMDANDASAAATAAARNFIEVSLGLSYPVTFGA